MLVRPHFRKADLDGELVFDRYLGADSELDTLQALLSDLASSWSSRLRVYKGPRDQRAIDITQAGALQSAVFTAALERGPTYRSLVQRYGRPPYERALGSVELRGSGPELIVVVSIDELIVSPHGGKKTLNNNVSLQLRRATFEGRPGSVWLSQAFERLAAEMSPAWGASRHPDEYWAKVMSISPRVEAVGRDFGKFLPGLFWLNFFGRRYCDIIGRERLRSVTAERVVDVDDGMLIEVVSDPFQWDSEPYAIREREARDWIGREFFFDRNLPDQSTSAPDWNRTI